MAIRWMICGEAELRPSVTVWVSRPFAAGRAGCSVWLDIESSEDIVWGLQECDVSLVRRGGDPGLGYDMSGVLGRCGDAGFID